MSGSEDVKLFCNGYYAEIFIMDPFSLEVIFSLSSREKSDWISALYVLRPAKRNGIQFKIRHLMFVEPMCILLSLDVLIRFEITAP